MDRGTAAKGGKNAHFAVVNYDDDDDFIDILNGFEAASNAGGSGSGSGGKVLYTPDDIFLDGSGAPTDRFLEALKMERDIITSRSHVSTGGSGSGGREDDVHGDTCSDDDDDDDDSGVRKNDVGYFNTASSVDNSDCDLSSDAGGANEKSSDRRNRSNDKIHKQSSGVGADNSSISNNNDKSRSKKHEKDSANNKQLYNRNEKNNNLHYSVVGASNSIDAAKKVSKYNAFGARKDENHGRYNSNSINNINNNSKNNHHLDEEERNEKSDYRNKNSKQQYKLPSSSSSRYKLTNDFESFDDDVDEAEEEEEEEEDFSRENISSDTSRVPTTHSSKMLLKTKDASSRRNETGDGIVATSSSPSSVESDIMRQFEEKKLEFEELSRKVLSLPIAHSDDPSGSKRDKYSISNLDLQKQLISVVHELKDILKTNEAVGKNAFMKPTISSSSRSGGGVSNAVDKKVSSSSSSSLNHINSSNSAPLENHSIPAPSMIAVGNEPKNVNSNSSSNSDAVVSSNNNVNNNNVNNNNNNNNSSSGNNSSNINAAAGPNDSKLKSLNLRLHGQMNTIKILELQIQEFNQVMQEKEKVISTLQRQVQMGSSNGGGSYSNVRGGGAAGAGAAGGRSVSPGYRNRYPTGSGNVRNKSAAIASEEHLEKVKTQMKDIESRHNADIVRYKLLKEYAEKAKFRVNELEAKVSEISEENTDLKEKNTRIKKELKDRINECAIYQENNIEHLKTINNMKSYVSEAEVEASQLRMENNKLKTEIQNLKMEVKLSVENSKNSKMEIEILKERLDNRKTESKLFSLISGNNSVLNPNLAAAASSSSSSSFHESSNNLGKYSMHDSNDNHSMKIVQRSKLMSFNNFISQAASSSEGISKKKPDHHPTGFVETAMRNRRHKHELDFSQGGTRTKLTTTNNSSNVRSSVGGGSGGGDSSSSNYNRSRSLSPSSRYTTATAAAASSSSSTYSNIRDSFSAAACSSCNVKPTAASKAVRYSFDAFDSRTVGVAFQSEPNKTSNSYTNSGRMDIRNADSDDDSDFDDTNTTSNNNTSNRMTLPPRVPVEAKLSGGSSNTNKYSNSSSINYSSNRERAEVDVSEEVEAASEGTPPRAPSSFDTATSSAIKSKYEKLKKMYEKVNYK